MRKGTGRSLLAVRTCRAIIARFRAKMVALIVSCVVGSLVVTDVAHAQRGVSDGGSEVVFPEAFALVPEGAAGAIVVPDLDQASDDLAQLFQSMGQHAALVGGRPIDQIRAFLGYHAGIDESGPFAVIFPTLEDGAKPIVVAPALDPEAFIDANLTEVDASSHRYRDRSGVELGARAWRNFVLMSRDHRALNAYNPGKGIQQTLATTFDQHAATRAMRGDVLLYGTGELGRVFSMLAQALGRSTDVLPVEVAPNDRLSAFTAAHIDASLVVINFDPLGLGVNAFGAIAPASPLHAVAAGAGAAKATMAHLPRVPFVVALSVDLEGFGGVAGVARLEKGILASEQPLPQWFDSMQQVEFAISPSNAGVRGGLFHAGRMFIETVDAASLVAAFRSRFEADFRELLGVEVELAWEEDSPTIDDVRVDHYAIAIRDSGARPWIAALQALLFGAGPVDGHVASVGDGVVVTFSTQRRNLEEAIDAARASRGATLADDVMLQQMGTWLPASPDVVMFVGTWSVGEVLGALVREYGEALPRSLHDRVPVIDRSVKPMGFGLDLREDVVEAGAVVPADALSIMVDLVIDAAMERLQRPEPGDEDGS